MICKECGKEFTGKIYPNGTCQGCYNYFLKGGTLNPLPLPGIIAKDERGYVTCHICGRSYKRLGSHIKESHDMTIEAYKEKFGLCANSRTTEVNYSKHMSKLAYANGMVERLAISGRATRIHPGETDKRKGKAVRLQECLSRRKGAKAT